MQKILTLSLALLLAGCQSAYYEAAEKVGYHKHNLNARAVASLQVEFSRIEDDIEVLIREMRKAIASSDAFIASMQQ